MENLSLFHMAEESQEQMELPSSGKLDVVKMEFSGAQTLSWPSLFSGFDTLHAITYSSGIGFVYELLALFEQAEVIFGCDEVISYSLQEVMAYQCKMVERMRETASKMKVNLVSRIDNGTLRFFVAHTVLSHEKIYLLSAKDGRKRVIMGSANMSFAAFNGHQRENICYIDGEEAYQWYFHCYNQLRDESTDQIAKESLLCADDGENLEELPIARTIRTKKALVLQPVETVKDEVRFVLDVKNLAAKLAPSVPKPDKKGKLMLSPEKIKMIRRQVVSSKIKEKELQSEYPQLEVFPDEAIVSLNGTKLDLNPAKEDIKKDGLLFLTYMMNGYEKFHGDVTGMQRRYFEFANWFFCSPFMACMRHMAVRYNQNLLPYPVFGLVYGQSKAGKTSFLETLLKMMIGQKTKLSAPDFTRSSIENLKRTVKGAPIIVDDLTNARFNQHAIETIKNDDFGVVENLVHYPAVVISANEDVKAVAPEVIRRTVICRVQAGLTNTEVMRSSVVRTVQREIGTAFYREYLRRMVTIVANLLEEIKNDASESAPDLLAASSHVLLAMLSDCTDTLPPYVRPLTLEDYFSEKVTGRYAMTTIRNAWKTSRTSFEISESANELRYNAGAPWEADRILKELPETLEAHKSRDWVVMNLEEARNFFTVPFKKSWLNRFRKE